MTKALGDLELFGDIYRNRRVLVTGHSGFKGSWLCMWLEALGANVLGYSLPPHTDPSHYLLVEKQLKIQSVFADICNLDELKKTCADFRPEIVFHLAAQPIVRLSYEEPISTLQTNIIGTANVLEACRSTDSVRAIVCITSDKCYENRGWFWGYRENEPMGGYDPYSVSKGCAELVAAAYRNSYFNLNHYGEKHHVLLASVRAGNVIGGGDWAKDRIVTDMMEATGKGQPFSIRNPGAIRPWQHVLEPLSGYLLVGWRLLEGKKEYAEAWNFGPSDEGAVPVIQLVQQMQKVWNKIRYNIDPDQKAPHEDGVLKLDCSKAKMRLHWKGIWDTLTTYNKTAEWYQAFYETGSILSSEQMNGYLQDAGNAGAVWVK